MSGKRKLSPEEGHRIAAHARQHEACSDCGAAPGADCTNPGRGRSVHKPRSIAAAITLKRQGNPARITDEAAVLAALPRIPAEEIEKCRTAKGGYSFTRRWFLDHGLPYPPIAGWRAAVTREAE
jgi:hypothetical protein